MRYSNGKRPSKWAINSFNKWYNAKNLEENDIETMLSIQKAVYKETIDFVKPYNEFIARYEETIKIRNEIGNNMQTIIVLQDNKGEGE
jgi:hypothetical protein